jgi:hypothetical protein
MFRNIMAVLLLSAPAAGGAQAEERDGWALARMTNGCMVQAVSAQGTMLSIWGFAGQSELGLLLQNREWKNLSDGERYRLSLDFPGVRSVPVDATARERIDADGPGLFFTLSPGAATADSFLDAFSTAKGMDISRDGEKVDTLALNGGRRAMTALAACLSDRWNAAVPASAGEARQPKTELDDTI